VTSPSVCAMPTPEMSDLDGAPITGAETTTMESKSTWSSTSSAETELDNFWHDSVGPGPCIHLLDSFASTSMDCTLLTPFTVFVEPFLHHTGHYARHFQLQ